MPFIKPDIRFQKAKWVQPAASGFLIPVIPAWVEECPLN
jgi:hypothetical protein